MTSTTITGRALVVAPIQTANKYVQVWNVIFNLLDGITHPDGKTNTNGTPKKWIYAGFPSHIISDTADASNEEVKSDYPILVVEPLSASYDLPTLDNKTREFGFTITLNLFVPRSDDLDEIMDSIQGVLENNSITDYLAACGVYMLKLVENDYDHVERSGVKLHNRRLRYQIMFESGI